MGTGVAVILEVYVLKELDLEDEERDDEEG